MQAAVLPASGIGDALLMMIAAHQLKERGWDVVTYHGHLAELSSWLPGHSIHPFPGVSALASCDLIIAENDNSPLIQELVRTARDRLSIFYPTYLASKHASLHAHDRVFDRDSPMADNVAAAIASLLRLDAPCKNNGLTPPQESLQLQHQILIHPTSRVPTKNWGKAGFLRVAYLLKEQGYTPVFCVAPHERLNWVEVEKQGFSLVTPANLADLAVIVSSSRVVVGNDSLAGHLASNLNIPTLTIAQSASHMRLWRPGWRRGALVLPPSYLPSWKCFQKRWQQLISPARVLRCFKNIIIH